MILTRDLYDTVYLITWFTILDLWCMILTRDLYDTVYLITWFTILDIWHMILTRSADNRWLSSFSVSRESCKRLFVIAWTWHPSSDSFLRQLLLLSLHLLLLASLLPDLPLRSAFREERPSVGDGFDFRPAEPLDATSLHRRKEFRFQFLPPLTTLPLPSFVLFFFLFRGTSASSSSLFTCRLLLNLLLFSFPTSLFVLSSFIDAAAKIPFSLFHLSFSFSIIYPSFFPSSSSVLCSVFRVFLRLPF